MLVVLLKLSKQLQTSLKKSKKRRTILLLLCKRLVGSSWAQNGAKRPPVGPRCRPSGVKWRQHGAHMAPQRVGHGALWLKMAPQEAVVEEESVRVVLGSSDT